MLSVEIREIRGKKENEKENDRENPALLEASQGK